MTETGVVKFRCEHVRVTLEKFPGFDELNDCRRELVRRGWIGVDETGVAFGNLSVRDGETGQFYITGSGTGAQRELGLSDYARVTDYDVTRNWLRCEGLTVASSESLTHAAIYMSCADARAIVHIHDMQLWKKCAGDLPATPPDVEYGTPAMANEVSRLARGESGLFRMAGHPGGMIAFAHDLRQALRQLIALDRS